MGNEMKTSINIIEGLVEKYPSDKQLGAVVRAFIKELQSHRRKREENND